MFHSRTFNNKINQLHEKALRIVHGDSKSKLDKLLEKDSSSVSVIEIFKCWLLKYLIFEWTIIPTNNE